MTAIVVRAATLSSGERADLLLEDGTVTAVGSVDVPAGAEEVDADGLVALPGLVDLHTHLREPGREDAETVLTGSRAAAAGGFTAVLAMANTSPVTDTAEAAEHVAGVAGRNGSSTSAGPPVSSTSNRWGRSPGGWTVGNSPNSG